MYTFSEFLQLLYGFIAFVALTVLALLVFNRIVV